MFVASLLSALLLLTAVPFDLALLEQAEEAFRQGLEARDQPARARQHFRSAAVHCETLRKQGVQNPDLFRNLGNAWLLAGDLPRAILAYRQGLVLAPHDTALRANLEHAREQVAYPAHSRLGRPPVDHWPPWLPRPAPRLLGWLAALGYGLGCLFATRWVMVRRGRFLVLAGVGFVAGFILAILLLTEEYRRNSAALHPLVVVAEDGVLLRKGNGLTYPPRYDTPLHRGVEARLLFAKGDWLQIELAGGEIGWVPREYVVMDQP